MTQTDLVETRKPHGSGASATTRRDPEILDAALDVLAETGYDGMTIDMVAARAKAGKATRLPPLGVQGRARARRGRLHEVQRADLASPPDTGTLRGDLVAHGQDADHRESERKLKVMAGIVSMIARDPSSPPRPTRRSSNRAPAANRIIFQRAIDRGEISADSDIETLCMIGPAMVAVPCADAAASRSTASSRSR